MEHGKHRMTMSSKKMKTMMNKEMPKKYDGMARKQRRMKSKFRKKSL